MNRKGQVALFVAVSISAFLLYLGLYTMNRGVGERRALIDAQNSVESFYLADTGVERFLYELKLQISSPLTATYGAYQSMDYLAKCINDNDCTDADTPPNNEVVTVGDGSYRIVVIGNVIKVRGSYRNVNRAIELSYSP
ncbi:MAG: hypothetical protein WC788_02430 [Candidatus Paceibacterota bacterium]